jgi:ferredoxin
MKAIVVDVLRDRCQGHGLCSAVAPEIYELDDDGYCVIGRVELPADRLDQARLGAKNCPEMAITVTEIDGTSGNGGV